MPTKKRITRKKVNKGNAVILSDREAPIQRKVTEAEVAQMVMTGAQMAVLMQSTPEHAIKTRQGPGGKMLKYIPHGYATDQLNKAFGFDWDYVLLPYFNGGSVFHLETIQVGINNKTKLPIINRSISVYGELTVKIHNPKNPTEILATIVKSGAGSSWWYPENELGDAIKSASSDGLKVAASKLGIGLDLYWDDNAEQNKLEELKVQAEKLRQQQDEEEIINAMGEDIPAPENGILMIAMAQAQFGYNFETLSAILKRGEIINSYTPSDWEKIIKHYEKESGDGPGKKKEGKGR